MFLWMRKWMNAYEFNGRFVCRRWHRAGNCIAVVVTNQPPSFGTSLTSILAVVYWNLWIYSYVSGLHLRTDYLRLLSSCFTGKILKRSWKKLFCLTLIFRWTGTLKICSGSLRIMRSSNGCAVTARDCLTMSLVKDVSCHCWMRYGCQLGRHTHTCTHTRMHAHTQTHTCTQTAGFKQFKQFINFITWKKCSDKMLLKLLQIVCTSWINCN